MILIKVIYTKVSFIFFCKLTSSKIIIFIILAIRLKSIFLAIYFLEPLSPPLSLIKIYLTRLNWDK